MKKTVWLLTFAVACLLVFVFQANAATVTVDGTVPYIHQVLGMDYDDFWGHNACGPTSAVMITEFHKLQPENTSGYPGWFVYNPYTNWTDKSGQDYDDVGVEYPNDGPYDMGPYPGYVHEHEIRDGAHGFIVRDYTCGQYTCWGADEGRLITYIQNHGLIVNTVSSGIFNKIKENINAGLPLIGHWTGKNGQDDVVEGHYFVIIGYDTGAGGTEENVIVHDPYGDRTGTWNGTTSGAGMTYSFPIVVSGTITVTIDRVYTVHPVGIFQNFPGWMTDLYQGLSQAFLDEYNNTAENGGEGIDVFGLPFDNRPNNDDIGPWVHEWPDATCSINPPNTCNTDGVYLQDFLRVDEQENEYWSQLVYNPSKKKVFPVVGEILEYWHDHYGYSNYGPPIERQHDVTDQSSNEVTIQAFKKGGVVSYIGYNASTQTTREYTAAELFGLVSYHALDGDANEESGEYDGTVSGAIFGDAIKGQAAYFNGSNSYIDIPNIGNTLNGETDLGISFWMKPVDSGAWKNPLSFCQTDSSKLAFETGDSYDDFGIYNSGIKDPYVYTFDNLENKRWIHAVFTADSDKWYFYLNNILIDSGDTEDGAATGAVMHLGKRYGSSGFWKGFLDEVRIYNRLLSAGEVSTLYSGGSVTSGLIAYYPLDGNADDEIGTNDGTVSNVIFFDAKKGQSVYFDGSDDYIDIPGIGTDLNGETELTIMFLMKPVAFVVSPYVPLAWRNPLSFCQSDSSKFAFETGYDYDDFGIYHAGIQESYVYKFDFFENEEWVLVTFVSDGDYWHFYINDSIEVASPSGDNNEIDGGANTGAYMHLGKRYASYGFWKGFLDEIRIYGHALTTTEINAFYSEYFPE